ncbi:STAS domain-containing protein [Streptomyces sp. NPDC048383]|uniref:STAS domain-containing protein n=1 Tax=Streptomyces sp. NPDC048383 TaxID=3155386 RepID=UPI003435E7B1
MTPLTVTARNSPTGPVLQIIGELDCTTAPDLRELLATLALEPGQLLVLDLTRMEFCDSSGISALIAARNHVQAAQADIALAAVPVHTLRVLRVIGLDQVFRLLPGTGS